MNAGFARRTFVTLSLIKYLENRGFWLNQHIML